MEVTASCGKGSVHRPEHVLAQAIGKGEEHPLLRQLDCERLQRDGKQPFCLFVVALLTRPLI